VPRNGLVHDASCSGAAAAFVTVSSFTQEWLCSDLFSGAYIVSSPSPLRTWPRIQN